MVTIEWCLFALGLLFFGLFCSCFIVGENLMYSESEYFESVAFSGSFNPVDFDGVGLPIYL